MTHPTHRRAFLRKAAATVGFAATAGCLGRGRGSPGPVEMHRTSFSPATVTVSVGDILRWENTSDVEHTVTAYEEQLPSGAAYFASGGFDSEEAARNNVTEGLVGPGDTYEHTFDQPGTYEYFCIPHESSGMTGTVHVK